MLNAFRHQRTVHSRDPLGRIRPHQPCSTPFGINELFTKGILRGCVPRTLCSTPFGINELFTVAVLFHRGLSPTVLNAFRHQRTVHSIGSISLSSARSCSTPFGINELFT